jgi:hypothetical protein
MKRIICISLSVLSLMFFGGVTAEAKPLNSDLIEKNCFEFRGTDKDGSEKVAFCGIKIGNESWLTIEHGPIRHVKGLEQLGIRIIKSDEKKDVAILSKAKNPDQSILNLAHATKGEQVWLIVDGEWISSNVLQENPMLIWIPVCKQGYSGKPIFNNEGKLVGILESAVLVRKTQELLCVGCVSAKMIEKFLVQQ